MNSAIHLPAIAAAFAVASFPSLASKRALAERWKGHLARSVLEKSARRWVIRRAEGAETYKVQSNMPIKGIRMANAQLLIVRDAHKPLQTGCLESRRQGKKKGPVSTGSAAVQLNKLWREMGSVTNRRALGASARSPISRSGLPVRSPQRRSRDLCHHVWPHRAPRRPLPAPCPQWRHHGGTGQYLRTL